MSHDSLLSFLTARGNLGAGVLLVMMLLSAIDVTGVWIPVEGSWLSPWRMMVML